VKRLESIDLLRGGGHRGDEALTWLRKK